MPHLNFDHAAALSSDVRADFDKAVEALVPIVVGWQEAPLPHFSLPAKTDDLPAMRALAEKMAAAFTRIWF